MIWSFIQVTSKQGITFIIFLILTWLLAPEDFGLLGIAMLWTTFLDAFSETGFSGALIQRQAVTQRHFSSVFFMNLIVALCLTIASISLSWLSARWLDAPAIQPLIVALSFTFIINAFSLTQISLAQKQLRFRDLAVRDSIATTLGGILGIGGAVLGLGVWSLVLQTMSTALIGAVTLWSVATWRPHISEFSWQHIKELWPYSSKLFIFNVFKFFAQNTEKFFIAITLNAYALGLYLFAFKLTALPVNTFVGGTTVYLFPKYSLIQQDVQAIKTSYLFTIKAILLSVGPIMAFVVILAPMLVPMIWSNKWNDAIVIIQILPLLAIAQAIISPTGQLWKAVNRPSHLMYWSIGVTFGLLMFVPLGAYYFNITGAAVAIVLVYLLCLPIIFFNLRRLIALQMRDLYQTMWPSIVITGLTALTAWLALQLDFLPVWIRVAGAFIGTGIVYVVSLRLLDRNFITTIAAAVNTAIRSQSKLNKQRD